MRRTRDWTRAIIALLCAAGIASAQRAKRESPEFTKQALLIVNFAPGPGADIKFARQGADVVRSRAAKLINNKQEVEVVDTRDVETALWRAGYNPDSMYALAGIRQLARLMRADEIVVGKVTRTAEATRIEGELILTRDEQLRQPLPAAIAPRLDSAAAMFAKELQSARAQLTNQRRCENALHDGDGQRALATAREAVAAYNRSTVARMCLVWALHQTHAPAAEVLSAAKQILAVDSNNVHAIEYAAMALDSLRLRDEAAAMWLRFAQTDTSDMDVALRVTYALVDDGNARRAEPFILHLVDTHPADIRLLQQKWRVTFENKNWSRALEAGEALLERDSTARTDSTFYLRLATVYGQANRPLKAIEILARGVSVFPGDGRLYSFYARNVKAEADTVVPRGLALFPRSADLAVLRSTELHARGKVAESLDASRRAVELDSTLAQGRLMVAQLEIELGRPDSALATLRKAVAGGEDSTIVAQFTLSKGNILYRAANATKTSGDFLLALRFLGFADSVRSTTPSKFLVGAAALGVAQSSLTEAAKTGDKTESCRLVRLGADMIQFSRTNLTAGRDAFAETATDFLNYLVELEKYVAPSMTSACGSPPSA